MLDQLRLKSCVSPSYYLSARAEPSPHHPIIGRYRIRSVFPRCTRTVRIHFGALPLLIGSIYSVGVGSGSVRFPKEARNQILNTIGHCA